MGNHADTLLAFFIGVIIIGITGIWAGCATRPVIVATDESVVSSQVGVARLQAANDGLRELLQVYDTQFGEQLGRAVGGIDEALDRLDEYDEFVQGLIRRVRELERATRTGAGESPGEEQGFDVGRDTDPD